MSFRLKFLGKFAGQAFGGAGLRGIENSDLQRTAGDRADAADRVTEKMPARNPLSHARCSGVKGALSGMKGRCPGNWRPASSCALLAEQKCLEVRRWQCRRVKLEKRFVRLALTRVGLEKPLHDWWQISEPDRGDQFARNALVLIGTAADDNLIAFFAAHLRAQQTDVADVMLCAGVRAAGDVQINRLVDLEAAIEMFAKLDSV